VTSAIEKQEPELRKTPVYFAFKTYHFCFLNCCKRLTKDIC
jgi:hypothetical protein